MLDIFMKNYKYSILIMIIVILTRAIYDSITKKERMLDFLIRDKKIILFFTFIFSILLAIAFTIIDKLGSLN
jgi:hypothetical protein